MEKRPQNLTRLANVAVVIVGLGNDIVLWFEIEETEVSLKEILGNTFACLISNKVAVKLKKEQRYFKITPTTRLVVAGTVPHDGVRIKKMRRPFNPESSHSLPCRTQFLPANATLYFAEELADTITFLKNLVLEKFPASTTEEA